MVDGENKERSEQRRTAKMDERQKVTTVEEDGREDFIFAVVFSVRSSSFSPSHAILVGETFIIVVYYAKRQQHTIKYTKNSNYE